MITVAFLVAVLAVLVPSGRAAPVEWEFPRLGTCHEGIPFSDGVTGVLVWGGGDEIRLTVGRADLWDHRGGYPWLASQSYTNIVALVQAGRKEELLGLFKKETPKGETPPPRGVGCERLQMRIFAIIPLIGDKTARRGGEWEEHIERRGIRGGVRRRFRLTLASA